jgi:hypothetical protein
MSEVLNDYNKNILNLGAQIIKDSGEFLNFDLDPHLRNTFAIILDSQDKQNNTVGGTSYTLPPYIKKLSLVTTIRTLLTLPNIMSIQSGSVGRIFRFGKAGEISSLYTRQSLLKIIPILHMGDLGDDFKYDEKNLDMDSHELSLNIADTVSRGVLKEMAAGAKTVVSLKDITVNAIMAGLDSLNNGVKDKINKSGSFVVLPLPIAKILKDEIVPEHSFDAPQTNIRRIGFLRNKWIVYINGFPTIDVVMGYQGNHPLDSGYTYHLGSMFHSYKKELGKVVVNQNANLYTVDGNFYGRLQMNADAILDSIKEL